MDVRIRLDELLEKIQRAYLEDQEAKGIKTTGKSAASVQRTINEIDGDLSGEVTGTGYMHQQRFGRHPGKFPPIQMILEWIRAKGIKPRDGKTSEKSLAFLFARKIARSGTDIFQGKRPALNIDDKINDYVGDFKAKVKKDLRDQAKIIFKGITF